MKLFLLGVLIGMAGGVAAFAWFVKLLSDYEGDLA